MRPRLTGADIVIGTLGSLYTREGLDVPNSADSAPLAGSTGEPRLFSAKRLKTDSGALCTLAKAKARRVNEDDGITRAIFGERKNFLFPRRLDRLCSCQPVVQAITAPSSWNR